MVASVAVTPVGIANCLTGVTQEAGAPLCGVKVNVVPDGHVIPGVADVPNIVSAFERPDTALAHEQVVPAGIFNKRKLFKVVPTVAAAVPFLIPT